MKKKVLLAGVMAMLLCVFILFIAVLGPLGRDRQSGQVYLYGELHSMEGFKLKENELWEQYYHERGMRHLFVELPFYAAEFLNLWMQAEDDEMLDKLFEEWKGTPADTPLQREFYQRIKENCPETVFHGTDVVHIYYATGERYLQLLRDSGQENSEKYRIAQEVIEQGIYYYEYADANFRENKMVENFIREYEALNGEDIMGIYGAAHLNLSDNTYNVEVPWMAVQLSEHYEEHMHIYNMRELVEPLRVERITIGDQEYEAYYYGRRGTKTVLEYWQLDLTDELKRYLSTGETYPYSWLPLPVEDNQIFVVQTTKEDGSVQRSYYRSDRETADGEPPLLHQLYIME